jgi:hypothetical protein
MTNFSPTNFKKQTLRSLNPIHNVANIFNPNRAFKEAAGGLAPDPLPTPPGTPTVDEAQRNIDESDRLRRRRGVYANIFAGSGAGTPSVGKATLGG